MLRAIEHEFHRQGCKGCCTGNCLLHQSPTPMFSVFGGPQPELQAPAAASGRVSSPKTAGGFSATAYYFGRELQKELGVPVGLIRSAVGGTPVEAWTSVVKRKKNAAIGACLSKMD